MFGLLGEAVGPLGPTRIRECGPLRIAPCSQSFYGSHRTQTHEPRRGQVLGDGVRAARHVRCQKLRERARCPTWKVTLPRPPCTAHRAQDAGGRHPRPPTPTPGAPGADQAASKPGRRQLPPAARAVSKLLWSPLEPSSRLKAPARGRDGSDPGGAGGRAARSGQGSPPASRHQAAASGPGFAHQKRQGHESSRAPARE